MVYPDVLFDFDYTLGDATDAIVAGFAAGFAALGLPLDAAALARFQT